MAPMIYPPQWVSQGSMMIMISKKLNKPMGYHVIKPDHSAMLEKIGSGYTFLAFSLDTVFLGSICRAEMKKLHEKLK